MYRKLVVIQLTNTMATKSNQYTVCIYDSFKELLSDTSTQTMNGEPIINVVMPREESYRSGSNMIHKSFLMMMEPEKYQWQLKMPIYYKQFIEYCTERGWKPPSNLAAKLKIYPRRFKKKTIMLVWSVDETIYENLIKLLKIKRHNLFNPKICIDTNDIKLKIDTIPIFHKGSPWSKRGNLFNQHFPDLTIKEAMKNNDYLTKQQNQIISTGYLEKNEHLPIFIIKNISKINRLAHQIMVTTPLTIITKSNNFEAPTSNKRKINIQSILAGLFSNAGSCMNGLMVKPMNEIVKVKQCGWCNINNKQLELKSTINNKLKMCICETVYYCCRNHQKRDWNSKHRLTCMARRRE